MVGTLVVTLPSRYSGGELIVGHNEDRKVYTGSRTALSLVAFYADCRHEVLKVKSGYRITLTYNLILHGDPSHLEGDEGTVAELMSLLREHFSTPVPGYYSKGTAPARPMMGDTSAEAGMTVTTIMRRTPARARKSVSTRFMT